MKSEAARSHNLSPLQLQILIDLFSHFPTPQPLSMFVERYAVARPTVSDSIKTLERRRLVVKRQSRSDKRMVNVALTGWGLRRATALSQWADFLLESVGGLPRAYQQALLSALVRIITAFAASGLTGVDRMCVTCMHFQRNKRLGMPKPHRCAALKIALGDADLRLDCNSYEMGKKAFKLLSLR